MTQRSATRMALTVGIVAATAILPRQLNAACTTDGCSTASGWASCLLPGGTTIVVSCAGPNCPEGSGCGACVIWTGDVATGCGCRCYRKSVCPTCLPVDP